MTRLYMRQKDRRKMGQAGQEDDRGIDMDDELNTFNLSLLSSSVIFVCFEQYSLCIVVVILIHGSFKSS